MEGFSDSGPYTYRQYEKKEDILFHDNDTISYFVNRIWVWDEALSNGNLESDIIAVFNPIPLTSARMIEKFIPKRLQPNFLSKFNNFLNDVNEELIVYQNVSDVLFEGFEDPVLTSTQEMDIDNSSILYQLIDQFNITIPSLFMDYDKFAWFYKRNNSKTYDGYFNMYTGGSNIEDIGKIDWWNFVQSTKYYDAPCNEVNGSAGEIFPPDLNKTNIQFYSTDVCVTLKMDFEKEVIDRHDIPGYRFWGSPDMFTNQTIHPENACYCSYGECAPTGLRNVETCRMGTPAFISFPHFFNADPYLLEDVVGLSPNYEDHAFFMTLNPDLGTPLEVAARFQINVHVKPYKGNLINGLGKIDMLENVRDLMLPLFWFEMIGGINEEMADDLKPVLFLMTTITVTLIFCIILLGSVLTLGFIFYRVQKRKKSTKSV